MSSSAIKAVAAKKSSTKRAPANSKLKSASSHPPYFEMIKDAITSLKERTGSSVQAISKFISEKEKYNLPSNYRKFVSIHLKRAIESGKLVKVRNSFKLSSSVNPSSVKSKKPAPPSTPAKTQKKPTTGKRPRSSSTVEKTKATKVKSAVSKKKPVVAKKSKKQALGKPVPKKPKSLKASAKKANKA